MRLLPPVRGTSNGQQEPVSSATGTATSCSWGGTTWCPQTWQGLTCWKAAQQKRPWASWLNTSQQGAFVAKEAGSILGCTGRNIASRRRDGSFPSARHWRGHTWSTGTSAGPPSTDGCSGWMGQGCLPASV